MQPRRRRSPRQLSQLFLSNIEYIALRLARKFLFPTDLQRVGRYLPFYRTNLAEVRPDQVCDSNCASLAQVSRSVEGKRIVEVGSGSTNGAGYALVSTGASRVWCIEPYVHLDPELARLCSRRWPVNTICKPIRLARPCAVAHLSQALAPGKQI